MDQWNSSHGILQIPTQGASHRISAQGIFSICASMGVAEVVECKMVKTVRTGPCGYGSKCDLFCVSIGILQLHIWAMAKCLTKISSFLINRWYDWCPKCPSPLHTNHVLMVSRFFKSNIWYYTYIYIRVSQYGMTYMIYIDNWWCFIFL